MIHIVFQEADIEVLNKAIELDETLQGKVELIRDDFAVGPIENIYETEGYQQRRDWWKNLLDSGAMHNSTTLMQQQPCGNRQTVHPPPGPSVMNMEEPGCIGERQFIAHSIYAIHPPPPPVQE